MNNPPSQMDPDMSETGLRGAARKTKDAQDLLKNGANLADVRRAAELLAEANMLLIDKVIDLARSKGP